MRALFILLCLFLSLAPLPAFAQAGWQLIWSDEFNGAANTSPDATKWAYDLGGGGWGNAEWQTYTSSTANSFLDGNGNLVIRAIRSESGQYTSARLKTLGKFTVTYGKIEARLKVPYGQGIWPAFWMLGADIVTAGWPGCGEIDVMENIGKEPSIVHGTVHGPGYSGNNPIGASYTLPGGAKFSDDFHVFTVVWSPESMEFFVDGTSYHKVTPASLPLGTTWVFNKPFFILLNVAVGGRWPGYPDDTSVFPQTMTVDYVRAWQATEGPAIHYGGVVNGASFGPSMSPGSLASIFGIGLANTTSTDTFDLQANSFRQAAGGTTVLVNGVASPLTYVSPVQINFQVPWETPPATPVAVQVVRDSGTSNSAQLTLAQASPSAFGVNGVAILTCVDGSPKPGGVCTLWGNGLGPLNPPQRNGVPAGVDPLPLAAQTCRLAIGGVDARVEYCGAAPGLVITQLNFVYPSGAVGTGDTVAARLRVGDAAGDIQLPLAR